MISQILVVSGGNQYYRTAPLAIEEIFRGWEASITVGTLDTLLQWIKTGINFDIIDWTYGMYGKVQLIAAAAGLTVIGNQWGASEVYKKSTFKTFLRNVGFPTPAFLAFDEDLDLTPNWLELAHGILGPRIVIKPESRDGLSDGIYMLNANDILGACEHLHRAKRIQSQVILEAFVDGTEYCIGFLPQESYVEVLPPAKVVKRGNILDHETKRNGNYEFRFENRLDFPSEKLEELGNRIRITFDLREPFYINGILDSNDELTIFDCGTKVGLSPKSYFPLAMSAAGYSSTKYLRELHFELWRASYAARSTQE